ncbi:MAG: hypothetical protein AB9891_06165 [Anaerolineaceae bacterium]
MEYPKKHTINKRIRVFCIGFTLFAFTICSCLAAFSFIKIFPALALMLFPSHILTASTQVPTATFKPSEKPAEISPMLPEALAAKENEYIDKATQILRECNQSVDDLSTFLDNTTSIQKPLKSDWINGFGNKVDQFSDTCSGLEIAEDQVPEDFYIFSGYIKNALREIPEIVENFRTFKVNSSQDNYDEIVKHFSAFRKIMDLANNELISLIQPAPDDINVDNSSIKSR